jgi:hypothetical protein
MDMNQFRKSLANKQQLAEANSINARYQINHDTIYSAFQTALKGAKNLGYQIADDEEFTKITTSNKPNAGQSLSYHIELTKGDLPQKKQLHIQIYKHETGRFELNFYIA